MNQEDKTWSYKKSIIVYQENNLISFCDTISAEMRFSLSQKENWFSFWQTHFCRNIFIEKTDVSERNTESGTLCAEIILRWRNAYQRNESIHLNESKNSDRYISK